MKRKGLLLLALASAILLACKPDDPTPLPSPIPGPSETERNGVFVLNEGNYLSGNATLTYYDIDEDSVVNYLFYKVNNVPLGDVGQSLAMADGKLFIVVNNSNNIWKVNGQTIAMEAQLGDFYSPREMHIVAPNKAYISDLIGTGLWIVNPQDMTHSGAVEMGKTTEKMVQVGNELYVSNWSYYYVDSESQDSYNTVQVVDVNNDTKVAEIEVGKEPNTMAVDRNGHVWVLCEGRSWDVVHSDDPSICENPSLWEIDPQLKTATKRLELDGAASCVRANPSGDKLYLIQNNEVRRFDVATMTLSDTFRIGAGPQSQLYNMVVEPNTGDIYVADAKKNYNTNGTVYRYSNDGVLLASFTAGLIPNAMLFK